jgi:hypothetical protein
MSVIVVIDVDGGIFFGNWGAEAAEGSLGRRKGLELLGELGGLAFLDLNSGGELLIPRIDELNLVGSGSNGVFLADSEIAGGTDKFAVHEDARASGIDFGFEPGGLGAEYGPCREQDKDADS